MTTLNSNTATSKGFLTGNMLKLIAAVAMLFDHIGVIFFPDIIIFKVIGRLAFPIFAFFIAEGCRYTRNKKRYFLTVFSCALFFQLVYFLVTRDTLLSIFVTFSFSILLIFAFQKMKDSFFIKGASAKDRIFGILFFVLAFLSVLLASIYLEIDYGFFGMLAPLFASLFHSKEGYPKAFRKLDTTLSAALSMAIPLCIHAISKPYPFVNIGFAEIPLRIFALFSIPILLMYSGKRGRKGMKYFFYIFYPAHLVILYGIYFAISMLKGV